ncbi:MAG: DNA-3-methyladenine glycosylase family protein [Gaiellales bacterium]
MLEVALTPHAPYRLRDSFGMPDPTRRARGGVLHLAYPTAGGPATARVWQRTDGTLRAAVEAADHGAAHDRLVELLGVRLDTRPFLRMAAADPLLAPLWTRLRGLRPIVLATPEHALVRAVCGQRIRTSEALAIERRILHRLGTPHAGFVLPPPAAAIASTHPAHFERAGLSPSRAAVLTRSARRLQLSSLSGEPAGTALRRITREPGLGAWSAGVVLVYGYGRHEHGLAGDLSLVRLARALGEDDDARLLTRYGEWQGLASLWLMRHPLAARHAVR